jgi:hypothetical protein
MVTNYPINPPVRLLGKARLGLVRRIKIKMDWKNRRISPTNPSPLGGGEAKDQCMEYMDDGFPAEIGNCIELPGYSINTFDRADARLASPMADLSISVVPAVHNQQPTPVDAIHLRSALKDINLTTLAFPQRDPCFDLTLQSGESNAVCSFRTPLGASLDHQGMQSTIPASHTERAVNNTMKPGDGDVSDDDEDIDEHDFDQDGGNGAPGGKDDDLDDDEDLGSGEGIDDGDDVPIPDKEEDDDDEDELGDEKEFEQDEYRSDWDEDDDEDDYTDDED